MTNSPREKRPPREKFDVHGWVALDKPLNMTSTHAVSLVRRLFKAKKGGHAGTLDPLASGVLPIALGEATKTVPYVMEGGLKTYQFTVSWGEERNTDDMEGHVTFTSDIRPSLLDIEAILPNYIGKIQQKPPQFSAIKVNGERAYDLARGGEVLELAAREVEVLSLKIVSHSENTTSFEALCGKGTYVRAFARDMGRDLFCYGFISKLRRMQVGPINEAHCISVAALEALAEMGLIENALHPIETGLQELDEVRVPPESALLLKRGQSVLLRGRDAPLEGHVWASCEGKLICIGDIVNGTLEPSRVFV
jgi:tRNA pseudouridine55 synthase